MKAFLEKEPAPEEPKAVEEPWDVHIGATDEEAIGAAKDRSRDLRLAVRCRGRLKTQTKRNGQVRQEHAATVGWPTHRFVPALCKGRLQKGPVKKCRSGIGGRGKASRTRKSGRIAKWDQQPAVRYQNPLKRQTQDNVV
jgi:hypothetical protein